ncbi:MAG TPA: MFS transporter [Ktedonosporobacter sp.]|nr:MFS transporter [Ktedonosporobacter sp.]
MEDLTLSSPAPSLVSPDLPEALRPPTTPVRLSFSILLTAANSVLFLCYAGVGGLLLPLQVGQIDPANKVANLGIGGGITVLLALLANPIAGALSDRTASRFGRRRPWIFFGAIVSAMALAVMMFAGNIVMLFVGWGLFQITSNLILAALAAIVPDQVPDQQRGTISGIIGLGIPVGSIVGSIVIGQVLKVPSLSYVFIIAILLLILIPYSLVLPDKALPREFVAPFNLLAFLKNFWVNPRQHPDFGWAWLTRFLSILGYFMGVGYLFYYLEDYIKFEQLFPGQQIVQGVSTVNIVSTLVSVVSTLIGGVLSDRFKRRKIFVVISSSIVALALLMLGFFPSWTMVLVASGVLGFGFGVYLSVDAALVTQVLPSATDRAKDLGIINIANTLPQSLAPVVAAVFITKFHSYPTLFVASAIVTLLSGILIQPIKSVR